MLAPLVRDHTRLLAPWHPSHANFANGGSVGFAGSPVLAGPRAVNHNRFEACSPVAAAR